MIFSDSFSMSAIIASLLSLFIDDLHALVPPYATPSVIDRPVSMTGGMAVITHIIACN